MTNKKCPSCWSCGMPMKEVSNFARENTESIYCSHCTDSSGNLLSYDEILQGTINFYMQSQGIHEEAARTMAQQLLASQPHWKK